ncbi:MAG: aldehyde dehydrogenase [Anaerolineaceae bacterium 4572_5.2]|nr:MAG: aldehyde dehydrogenase [Anaerolineaceae bacterium 4572_5.2]
MKMLLNGEWVDRSEKLEVRNPQDNSLIDTVPQGSAEDMKQAITAAVVGAERARKETIPFDQMPGSENRLGYYFREPVGIIGAITPFNDPLNLVAHKVGPAIAGGNAIIVKPDSKTPLSALMLGKALHEAGIPSGALQVIPGPGRKIGDVLVGDPRVRMISFTGGPNVGKAIMRKVGLKKVGMELGSNSPVIVMPDADLGLALDACVSGGFWAAGQNCLHTQRLLVHDKIYDEFAARFVTLTEAYKVGDKLDEATDMGPLINETEAIRVERMVNEAIEQGATLLTGGKRNGSFYDPTALADLPETCELAQEEIYGPVVILYRFHTLDEAIQRANDVDYGLQAGIFTRDIQTAFQAAADLQCGGVMINDSTDYRIDDMPFGGVKGSGLGREGIRFALQEMTEPKVVCFNLPDKLLACPVL